MFFIGVLFKFRDEDVGYENYVLRLFVFEKVVFIGLCYDFYYGSWFCLWKGYEWLLFKVFKKFVFFFKINVYFIFF